MSSLLQSGSPEARLLLAVLAQVEALPSPRHMADAASLRHLFSTNLGRVDVKPKMAQTLAHHSDIHLTLGVYTHVELYEQTAAIESLPAPPNVAEEERREDAA